MASDRVTIHIDGDLVEPYKLRAASSDRSLSAEVRQALRRDLQRQSQTGRHRPIATPGSATGEDARPSSRDWINH